MYESMNLGPGIISIFITLAIPFRAILPVLRWSLTKPGLRQTLKAVLSIQLFTSLSMGDNFLWELIWDTKIFTFCSHSQMSVPVCLIPDLLIPDIPGLCIPGLWEASYAICHCPYPYILTSGYIDYTSFYSK